MKILAVILATVLLLPSAAAQGPSAPPGRNIRGIHALTRGAPAEVETHLSWAQHLIGDSGAVTQPFSSVDRSTTAPPPSAVEFVTQAYSRGLNPIVKLQGVFSNQTGCDPSPREGWAKPLPDESGPSRGRYLQEAAGYRAFVAGLPRVDGRTLYVEVGNEPNLHYMWGGRADPTEYARFLVDVAVAIRSLGDARIRILNAGLAPQGDVDNLVFIRAALAAEPAFGAAFDVWASHAYPHNQPPDRNLHDGTALPNSRYTIDAYLLELEALRAGGVDTAGLSVILTETGYQLGEQWYPEYPPITEENRAEYTLRAFEEFWPRWAEVLAVTPFQLSDPNGSWGPFDWVHPTSTSDEHGLPTRPRLHYARLIPGTGVVQGLVTDSTGNPLKDVAVTTGASGHRALSAEDGSYVLIAPPGPHEITVDKPGYVPPPAVPVSVAVGGVLRLNLALQEQLPSALQNPDFEAEELAPWTPWGTVDGVQQGPWHDVQARRGARFLGTATNCGEKDGGVFQSVAVQSGRSLRLDVWLLTYREGDAPIGSRIGLGPSGTTDPRADTIVWSPWTDTDGKWRKVTVSAVAAGEKVSVFLQYDQNAANRWNINAFDAVELVDQE